MDVSQDLGGRGHGGRRVAEVVRLLWRAVKSE